MKSLFDFFKSGSLIGLKDSHDVITSIAVLLLEMAGGDEDYAPEETRTIFATLGKQFGLSKEQSYELLEKADLIRAEKGKIDEFVDTINKSLDVNKRQTIMAMLWKVVIADGRVDKMERRFATQMKQRLQLTDEQAEAAQELAQQGKV